jgi:acetyl esterase/lipase
MIILPANKKSVCNFFSKIINIIFIFPVFVFSQNSPLVNYPPMFPDAQEEVYKTIGEIKLKVWIFSPKEHQENANRPAIIFFFGGGWRKGNPTQFVKHCEYLAARGMVAMTADYRVFSRHNVKAVKCVSDAKSAIRWVRQHASRLGIDLSRIVASGGSAGGHLAVSTATLTHHNDPTDDLSISAQPNAMVLFNPVVLTTEIPGQTDSESEKFTGLRERLGADPKSMSPYHHIKTGYGPTIIFHGIEDTTVPFKFVDLFSKKMRELGNRCDLIGYVGSKHGFFNYGRESNGAFIDTMQKMDAFLVSIGYLKSLPETVITM